MRAAEKAEAAVSRVIRELQHEKTPAEELGELTSLRVETARVQGQATHTAKPLPIASPSPPIVTSRHPSPLAARTLRTERRHHFTHS